MQATGPVDAHRFRKALNVLCVQDRTLNGVSQPIGTILVKWTADQFTMRVKGEGANPFATVLRGKFVHSGEETVVRYRFAGMSGHWMTMIAVGFLALSALCYTSPTSENRWWCWVPVADGLGGLSLVILGRVFTRYDAYAMRLALNNAVEASSRDVGERRTPMT